jgi:Spy/CpxP family protein refolding chaperone
MKPQIKLFVAVAAIALIGMSALYFSQKQHLPYVGLQHRTLKSLSEQDIASLREGKGMGYALSAELNGYPGPRHVLDIAKNLSLTDTQMTKTRSLFQRMKAEAIMIGEQRISAEKALDEAFSRHELAEARLYELTLQSSRIDGQLRATHLKYHLTMMDILTPDQVQIYQTLRGYDNASNEHKAH